MNFKTGPPGRIVSIAISLAVRNYFHLDGKQHQSNMKTIFAIIRDGISASMPRNGFYILTMMVNIMHLRSLPFRRHPKLTTAVTFKNLRIMLSKKSGLNIVGNHLINRIMQAMPGTETFWQMSKRILSNL